MDEELIQDFNQLFEFDKEKQKNILSKLINDNMIKLATITYEFNNTVGPKSISKQELISKFNEVL